GTLDTSFGTGGKVTTDFAGSYDQAHSVAVQADGRLVVAGLATFGAAPAADVDFAGAPYLPDGALGAGFGSGGQGHTNSAGTHDAVQGLALQADGKIVAAGRVAVDGGANPDVGVVRYTAAGGLDGGFGSGGIFRSDFGLHNWEEAAAVAVQGDGKIVVAGNGR